MSQYAADGALARRQWSNKTVYECRMRDFFHKHKLSAPAQEQPGGDMSDNAAAPLVTHRDFSKQMLGDTLRIPRISRLTGTGVTGDDTLEGEEEDPAFGYLDVIIDQLRHADQFLTVTSAIRNPLIRTRTLKKLLMNWMIEKVEYSKFYAMYLGASPHCITESRYTATAHPNTYFATQGNSADGASADTLTPADSMGADVLDAICERVDDSSNPIAPCIAPNGEEGYIVIVSPRQRTSLKQDSRFGAILKDAWKPATPGSPGKHPLFSTAEYVYENLYIYTAPGVFKGNVTSVLTNGTSSHHGAIVMGAMAMGEGFGSFPQGWIEGARGEGAGHDKDGNLQFLLAPSDDRDYLNKDKWAISGLFCHRRADYTLEADSSTINRSSLIYWTQEGGE